MTETRIIKMSQKLFVQLICSLESNRLTCKGKLKQYENQADETALELVEHFSSQQARQKQAQKELNQAWREGRIQAHTETERRRS